MNKYPNITRKGTTYFASGRDAVALLDEIRPNHPEARLVAYQLGIAIQYYRSGPYFAYGEHAPSRNGFERESHDGCDICANWPA